MRNALVLSIAASSVLAIAGCSDTVQPSLISARPLDDRAPALLSLIAPVQRATPLSQDVTWSFVAGPLGGSTTNTATGLTFTVPAGALSGNVTITITALAGSPVAYRFEPHGLVFAQNATIRQDLTVTTANLLTGLLLSGAYFSSDTLELDGSGLAIVSEVIGAITNPLTMTATFPVGHFSGYILASGRSEPDSTEGEE